MSDKVLNVVFGFVALYLIYKAIMAIMPPTVQLYGEYVITSIQFDNMDHTEDIQSCLQAESIIFSKEDLVFIPAINKPISASKFQLESNNIININSLDTTILNGKGKYSLRSDRVEFIFPLVTIKAKKIGPALGTTLTTRIFDRTTIHGPWESDACKEKLLRCLELN